MHGSDRTIATRELASAYFAAWRARDAKALRALLAEDVAFEGPLGRASGVADYASSMERLFALTTGIDVKKLLVDDEDALTWFELRTTVAPPAPVVNWTHVEGGKIVRVRAVFDPRPLLAGRSR